MLSGLAQINIELTSRCSKRTLCAFCGHQNLSINKNLKFGEMKPQMMYWLGEWLAPLGKNLVVQYHRDGDPLDAVNLLCAFSYMEANVRSVVTHGERLSERAEEIINHCESVTVSIFRGDPDRQLQLDAIQAFLEEKGARLPQLLLKVVGDMTNDELADYTAFQVPILRRLIHTPTGNAKYAHRRPTLPEHGICLDLLGHPSVAWDGRVYLCNRLDTKDAGLIGNLNEESLDAIWNGKLRASYIQAHIEGRRADVPPCKDCTYYGVPTQ